MIHKNFELAKQTQLKNAIVQNNLVQSSVEYELLQLLNSVSDNSETSNNNTDNNNADKTDNIINTVKEQVEKSQKLDKVAGILLDAGVPGSGKTFDWNSIKELEITEKKLFLAGGLNSGNVAAAVKCVQPDVVDISSGVEYEDVLIKGKDESKVKAFINAVNN